MQVSGTFGQSSTSYADKVQRRLFFSYKGDVTLRVMIRSCQVSTVREFIHVHFIWKFQEDLIKTEWLMLMQSKISVFFSNQGGHNSKSNIPIWAVFKIIRDCIHYHLICKFQEHPIKTQWVTLMTISNRSFFSNKGDVTLKLWSDLAWFQTCLRVQPYRPYIYKMQEHTIKTELWWWQTFPTVKKVGGRGKRKVQGVPQSQKR